MLGESSKVASLLLFYDKLAEKVCNYCKLLILKFHCEEVGGWILLLVAANHVRHSIEKKNGSLKKKYIH